MKEKECNKRTGEKSEVGRENKGAETEKSRFEIGGIKGKRKIRMVAKVKFLWFKSDPIEAEIGIVGNFGMRFQTLIVRQVLWMGMERVLFVFRQ